MEAAKQSRRTGVMQLDDLTDLNDVVIATFPNAFFLDASGSESISRVDWQGENTLLIGPEGGWTDNEIEHFKSRGLRGLRLTDSILRVETAAVAAAAVVLTSGTSNRQPSP